MKIEVLSYDEHVFRRKTEMSLNEDKSNETYERWASARESLLNRLSIQWVVDLTEFGDGDFFIGEDWFERNVLSIVVLKWQTLSHDFLHECKSFLTPPYEDFLLTVVKFMPEVEDMFELIITRQRAYISFYDQAVDEARSIIYEKARYEAVRALSIYRKRQAKHGWSEKS